MQVKGITLFITFSSFLYILLDLHVAAVRQLRFPIRHQRLGAVGRGHSHHLPHSTTNFHKIRCSTTNDDVTSSRLTNLSTTRERHENIYLDLVHVEGWVHDLAVALPFVAVGEHEALAEEAGDVRGLVSFLGYSPVWSLKLKSALLRSVFNGGVVVSESLEPGRGGIYTAFFCSCSALLGQPGGVVSLRARGVAR
jgi:hypothetical protein